MATASFDDTGDGVAAAVGWLSEYRGDGFRAGVEGSSGHGRHLAEQLDAAGVDVREVPPRRTAEPASGAAAGQDRRGGRAGAGLGAAFDELAVVRAHRNILVARRTGMLNQAEATLGELPLAVIDTVGTGRAVLPRLRALAALTTGAMPAAVTARLALLGELHRDVMELGRRLELAGLAGLAGLALRYHG